MSIRRTPVTAEQACVALSDAWRTRFRETIAPGVLRLLLALWDLETATGDSQFHFNFGNIIATSDTQRFYVADDSGNTRRFRVYDSIQDGADGLIQQLTRDSRRPWHEALLTGDPERFVDSLKNGVPGRAYFEAPQERYLTTFLGRWRRYPPKATPPSRGQERTSPRSRPSSLPIVLLLAGAFIVPLFAMRMRARRS